MPPSRPSAPLSPEDQRLLADRLAQFEASWTEKSLASELRRLPPAGSGLREALLLGLARADLRRRWALGKRPTVEAYLKAVPELGAAPALTDLVRAEWEARLQAGAAADLGDLARRFPLQAAELSLTDPSLAPAAATRPGPSDTPAVQPPAGPGALPEQFGRYRILGVLGRGGMGTVYLARDDELDRRVALKAPHFHPDDREAAERFTREGRAAAALRHPNLCPVYDAGEIDGVRYLAMAYIEGSPLSRTARPGPSAPAEAVELVRKLALALAEAHERGVVHRDLKPSNVMITPRGEPVVMDFGLARRLGTEETRLTQQGALLGTPSYMAPEQIDGDLQAMGPACDVYALGVILYELLTGQVPFRGPLTAVLRQIATEPPPPVASLRPEVGPALEAVCSRAMAKRPEQRFGSMRQFAAALEEWLQAPAVAPEQAAEAPSDRTLLQGRARSRGRIWFLLGPALGGGLIALAVAAVWLSGVFNRPSAPPAGPDGPAPPPARPDPFPDWETFTPAGGACSVRLPGRPSTEKKVEQTANGPVERTEYNLRAGPFHYNLSYADFPGRLFLGPDAEKALDAARDGAVNAVKGQGGRLRESRRVELDGFPGRDVVIEVGDGARLVLVRCRLYLVKQRFYQLTIAADAAEISRAEVDYFLDSLRLAPR
jgi:predicted Ser/Thr protein kinase